jgi:secreted PhoX family phosphatase
VLDIADIATDTEFRAKYGKTTAAPVSFQEVEWDANGQIQNMWAKAGLGFTRVEDGAFDPANRNVYYFVTTESNKDVNATKPNPATPTVSRDGGALWRLTFKDVSKPLLGGTLEMLLDGSEAPYLSKPDNIEVDSAGNVLIQEDPGNNAHLARLLAYNIASKKIAVVAQFAAKYFDAANTETFITADEESSGVTEVTSLFKSGATDTNKYYILNAQIHATIAKARPDLTDATSIANAIEGGQVYLLTVSDWTKIYQ